jgi:hypothetical protein
MALATTPKHTRSKVPRWQVWVPALLVAIAAVAQLAVALVTLVHH